MKKKKIILEFDDQTPDIESNVVQLSLIYLSEEGNRNFFDSYISVLLYIT